MSIAPADLRHQAAAIRSLAVSRIDWTKNPNVVKRYAHSPLALQGMCADAQEALKGAEMLVRVAEQIERKGPA